MTSRRRDRGASHSAKLVLELWCAELRSAISIILEAVSCMFFLKMRIEPLWRPSNKTIDSNDTIAVTLAFTISGGNVD